mmetsp:Transcript_18422/g.25976  ORF Transcript_18422/g.25976 Transcript_18422/m.25976 type:complete len:610 (+) Transcript_18422:384-2213(+)
MSTAQDNQPQQIFQNFPPTGGEKQTSASSSRASSVDSLNTGVQKKKTRSTIMLNKKHHRYNKSKNKPPLGASSNGKAKAVTSTTKSKATSATATATAVKGKTKTSTTGRSRSSSNSSRSSSKDRSKSGDEGSRNQKHSNGNGTSQKKKKVNLTVSPVMRRTLSLQGNKKPSKHPDLRSAHSEGCGPTKRLDKFGFILNMDDQGNLYEDSIPEETQSDIASIKAEDVRVERKEREWKGIVGSWDTHNKRYNIRRRKRLVRRLRQGVPHSMRGKIWCLLGNVRRRIDKDHVGYYAKLVRKANRRTSEDWNIPTDLIEVDPSLGDALQSAKSFRAVQDTIDRDIHRTFPRHNMFHEEDFYDSESDSEVLASVSDENLTGCITQLETYDSRDNFDIQHNGSVDDRSCHAGGGQAALRRVLRAYSMHDVEVGYCQGMNFIAAMFLTFMSEEESFWLLVAVMNDPPCRMRGMFGTDMQATHQVLHVADKLIHQFLPRLARHLDNENVHITMYATQWLLTLYTSSFKFDLVLRVWDCYLAEGKKVAYRVMLALMQQSMPVLMTLSFENILAYFRDIAERVEGNAVMETAMKIPLKTKHIVKYEKEWIATQQEQQQS